MTKLDCTVTTCVHNAEKCCCKSGILVEGAQAKNCCDTCCGSFDDRVHTVWCDPRTVKEENKLKIVNF